MIRYDELIHRLKRRKELDNQEEDAENGSASPHRNEGNRLIQLLRKMFGFTRRNKP